MFEVKFKVGDRIIGKEHNGYSITNQNAIMVVTNLDEDLMRVKIVKHKTLPGQVGFSYIVGNNFACFGKAGATFI